MQDDGPPQGTDEGRRDGDATATDLQAAQAPLAEPVAIAEPQPQPQPGPEPQRQPEPETVMAGHPEVAQPNPAVAEVAHGPATPQPSGAVDLVTGSRVLDLPNEAIPAVPPEEGQGPVGSIPAAHTRQVWARLQTSNWRLFLVRFLCAGLAVVATVVIVPGLGFVGWQWGQFLRIALIFGVLNATVKPLLQFLVLRFIFNTYGIVVVVINTILLVMLAVILDDTFEASRPVSVLVGGLVVGVLGLLFETLLGANPPVLDRDYKERNGLR